MDKDTLIDFILKTEIPDNLESKKETEIVSKIFKYCWDITPKNLYRYRAINENNINALIENKFLLTKPTLFNDPFDSLLFVDRQKIVESLNSESDIDVIEKLKNDSNFREEQVKLLGKEFVDRHLELNSFESKAEKEIYTRLSKEISEKFIDKIIEESLKSLKQSSLVACLSEDYSSILMWSHYADNHRGFALNYDFNERFSIETEIAGIKATEFADKKIFPVRYSNQRYDATYYVEFHFIENHFRQLGIDFKQPFFDKLFYYKILMFKSLDWSYEKEWRIIKQTNLNYVDNKPNIEFIDNITPKEILLGTNVSEEYKKKLKNISKEKNIPIYQMKLETFNKEYKLTKEDV